MTSQLTLELDSTSDDNFIAKNVSIGTVFSFSGEHYLRVKPVNFLLNSNLVGDQITRGNIFVVRLKSATLSVFDGTRVVKKVAKASLKIQE